MNYSPLKPKRMYFRIFLFLTFFLIEIFLDFSIQFLNKICFDRSKKAHLFYKEKLESMNYTTKKKFYMDVVQFWNFFL